MNHLDLFSGIGGFSLGLESTGYFRTVAFCEIEDFPRRVLAKHWPDVPCYEDVRDVGAERLAADGIGRVDIVTGGFPCQDVSLAGARAGLSGERSGLWSELFRVITEVRPTWAIVENVPGLRTLGADAVLADLAGAGYAAWPLVVGAVHAGAPHRRQRVWIVAHADNNKHNIKESEIRTLDKGSASWRSEFRTGRRGNREAPTHSPGSGCKGKASAIAQEDRQADTQRNEGKLSWRLGRLDSDASHSQGSGRETERQWGQSQESWTGPDGEGRNAADTKSVQSNVLNAKNSREHQGQESPGGRHSFAAGAEQWDWSKAPEPVLRGVDDGLPCGMDRRERLKALGNAVVPQIVAAIGRAIITAEQKSKITYKRKAIS